MAFFLEDEILELQQQRRAAGASEAAALREAVLLLNQRLAAELARGNRGLRMLPGLLTGFFYLLLLLPAALGVWLFTRHRRPDAVDRDLGRAYPDVPVSAVYKRIELEMFLNDPPTAREAVLDLGCGNGIIGGILQRHGNLGPLVGVDFDPNKRFLVFDQGYRHFVASDVSALPFATGSFPQVMSICVLEHIADLHAALADVARTLRPGGRLAFSTPVQEFGQSTLEYRFFRALGRRERAERFLAYKEVHAWHHHCLPAERWHTLLQEAGFTDIQIHPFFSRRQLLICDLLNFIAFHPRYYFYDKLHWYFRLLPGLRPLMRWVATTLTARLGHGAVAPEEATHYYIRCTRAADG